MKFFQLIRNILFAPKDKVLKDFESEAHYTGQRYSRKKPPFLDFFLICENWYGTPWFTENYQPDISDGYPDDFVPYKLSKSKLNPLDYVLRSN